MRRLSIVLLFLVTSTVSAQIERRNDGDWTSRPEKGCIGGSTCGEKRLRIPLEDRPVLAVRFHAHDQIGQKADGELRVKIDGNIVRHGIDIPRKGEVFTIDVDELRGRFLVLETATNDEVEISNVSILYGRDTMRRIPRDRDWDRDRGRGDRSGGWRQYPKAAGCIGGDECRQNGRRITIALENRPVLGIRFYAHDSIGQRADGRLAVRIDDSPIDSYIDVQRAGKRHELDVEEVYGSKLIIETTTDDEVEVKDVEVLYGARGRRGNGRWERETRHEGGCIGGDECGGRRARIRVELDGRPVSSIRFYSRDDVGTRAKGELHIRIDDETLTWSLDIPREGKTFTIDGKGIAGDYLYFEPASDDEIVLRDIRVEFAEEEEN